MRPLLILLALGLLRCGDGLDKATGCAVDGECPLHQFCNELHACVSGCLSDEQCPEQGCNAHGRCVDDDNGFHPTDGGEMRDLSLPDSASTPDLSGSDLASVCSGACDDTREPNDKATQATMLSSTVTLHNVALCDADITDWYKVSAAQAGTLEVELINGPCGVPLRIDLFGSDGASPVGMSGITAAGWHASGKVVVNQVRYIRVQAALNPGRNPYLLIVTNPPST